jgi:hypothetical protein
VLDRILECFALQVVRPDRDVRGVSFPDAFFRNPKRLRS